MRIVQGRKGDCSMRLSYDEIGKILWDERRDVNWIKR